MEAAGADPDPMAGFRTLGRLLAVGLVSGFGIGGFVRSAVVVGAAVALAAVAVRVTSDWCLHPLRGG